MKALGLLIALASLACCAASQSCFSRQEKKDLAKMRMANRCKDPTERFVHVPVPDGFEYIMPSTVQVKRCDGYCWMMNRACLPTKIEKKMVKVQATRMAPNMVTAMECPVVEVDEHVSCGCECMTSKEDCSENQEFDDKSCSCMCKEDLREMCGGDKMWSSERCLCISNGVLQEMAGDLDD
ncbi:balbiani ring protein 3-like [Macrobrachium nipponense]|uniref:balbiani ring protein 3-like n=1 Tax=Macrobrachium nipponense TaxID=159736 RepID=UPI0030C83895